jgi:hypothetical protein
MYEKINSCVREMTIRRKGAGTKTLYENILILLSSGKYIAV